MTPSPENLQVEFVQQSADIEADLLLRLASNAL